MLRKEGFFLIRILVGGLTTEKWGAELSQLFCAPEVQIDNGAIVSFYCKRRVERVTF
jgi:hypothetical protein